MIHPAALEPVDALRRIAFLLERSRAETRRVEAYRNAAKVILPLGEDEVKLTKEAYGWDPDESFYVPDEAKEAYAEVPERGKQLQAKGAGLPQIEVVGALGPSPRARGNQVSSPDDQYSPDVTGVFVRAGVEIIQPIFTWGLIRNAKEAAEQSGAEQKKAIREAVALANEEGFPKDPEEVEAYFMQEVAQGEGMVQKGASRIILFLWMVRAGWLIVL